MNQAGGLLMKTMSWRGFGFGIAGLMMAAGTVLAAPFENNLEKTFSVSPGGKFVLDADQGSCEINAAELSVPRGGTRILILFFLA